MAYYDPTKDRSNEFDWKKYCDEQQPTELEQNRWSKIMLLFAGVLIIIGITVGG